VFVKEFESAVLRRMVGPKREKVTGCGENFIMRSFMISTPDPMLCW
jgi:hypothetical protein